MTLLYALLEVAGRAWRRQLSEPEKVGILFLKPLGIGDLIMLSPAIQAVADIFPRAQVELITWIPKFIDFQRIRWVEASSVDSHGYDLLVSPTLNLHHWKYIWKTKRWAGYFAKNIIQSNIGADKFSYHLGDGHYLLRGIHVLKALDQAAGEKLLERFHGRNVSYPPLQAKKPEYFERELANSRYLVLGVLSRFPDRQWPLERFIQVTREILQKDFCDKIVLIGDESREERGASREFKAKLNLPSEKVFNATGLNSLQETAYLIQHSSLFLGLDSGPSHIAYALANKAVVIFVTVPPVFRLPSIRDMSNRVKCVYPNPEPPKQLYSGLTAVNISVVKKYVDGVTVSSVLRAVEELFL